MSEMTLAAQEWKSLNGPNQGLYAVVCDTIEELDLEVRKFTLSSYNFR
jgi:hypothetical protein